MTRSGPRTPVGIRRGYKPALDGVRAVAVAIVILFHLGAGGLRVVNGGWLVLVPTSPVARILSLRPLTWVGRRAYGIYLLHPLMLDLFARRTTWKRFPLEIAVIGATLVGAGLSFRYLETPFLRLKERFSSQ